MGHKIPSLWFDQSKKVIENIKKLYKMIFLNLILEALGELLKNFEVQY